MTTQRRFTPPLVGLLALGLMAVACSDAESPTTPEASPRVDVLVEGLLNPVGLAELPDGGILIAEEGTGEDDSSAGMSVLTPDGAVGRVVSGLPSGRDSGDLSGAPLAGVAPDGSTAYVAHFGSQALLTFPIPPDGLVPETRASPARRLDDLTPTMTPLNDVALRNPFDIAFDAAGLPVVSDASENGVATVNPDGTTRFTHRFGQLEDPARPSLKIDPVPTGITRVGDEYLVTLTGGCPYPASSGVLVAVGPDRAQRLVATDLNMPIDVTQGRDGTLWLLEFAQFDPDASCFTGEGYRPATGRLSRLEEDGTLTEVVAGLDFPGAVLAASDGDLYITEIFSGRLLRLSWDEADSTSSPVIAGPPVEPWQFVDVAADVGVDFHHGAFAVDVSDDPVAGMGGGVCWIDYNRDGWLDLYLVNSHSRAELDHWEDVGRLPANELYRNDAGTFTPVGESAGVAIAHLGNGCVAADFDGDGWSDLFVTADGPNVLFRNQGDGTFADVSATAGVATEEWNSAAVVGDLNGDGRPDMFVGSFIDLEKKIDKPSGAFPQDYLGLPDRLFLNVGAAGAISFEDVTESSGLGRSERTLGALFSDFDRDGDLDLYVANDGHPNRLYRNDTPPNSPNISLIDVTGIAGVGDSGSGMGVAGGDYDGNGSFDLLITNWEAELNALYANRTDENDIVFNYMTQRIGMAGLGNNKTGWGAAWSDLDLDSDLDMMIVHGRVPVTDLETDPELIRLYGNLLAEGSPGEFRDWTDRVGLDIVGPRLARGSAVADFDNDGDPDIAVNSVAGAATLLRNEGADGHWLEVAIDEYLPGTVVTVRLPDGTVLEREWHTGSSYLSSEDPRLHFGLGDSEGPLSITIVRPDGSVGEHLDVAADQIYSVP